LFPFFPDDFFPSFVNRGDVALLPLLPPEMIYEPPFSPPKGNDRGSRGLDGKYFSFSARGASLFFSLLEVRGCLPPLGGFFLPPLFPDFRDSAGNKSCFPFPPFSPVGPTPSFFFSNRKRGLVFFSVGRFFPFFSLFSRRTLVFPFSPSPPPRAKARAVTIYLREKTLPFLFPPREGVNPDARTPPSSFPELPVVLAARGIYLFPFFCWRDSEESEGIPPFFIETPVSPRFSRFLSSCPLLFFPSLLSQD